VKIFAESSVSCILQVRDLITDFRESRVENELSEIEEEIEADDQELKVSFAFSFMLLHLIQIKFHYLYVVVDSELLALANTNEERRNSVKYVGITAWPAHRMEVHQIEKFPEEKFKMIVVHSWEFGEVRF
jgi:hypothetical protein